MDAKVTASISGRRNSLHASYRFELADPVTGSPTTYTGAGLVYFGDRYVAEHEGRLAAVCQPGNPADRRPRSYDSYNGFILQIAFAAFGFLLIWYLWRDIRRGFEAHRAGMSTGHRSPFWKASDEAMNISEYDEHPYRGK